MKFLTILFAAFLFCFAQKNELLIGILGSAQQKRDGFNHLSKPEILPFILEETDPGSSSWVVEESDQRARVDYVEALQLVRRNFKDKFQLQLPEVSVRNFPFSTQDDLKKIMRATAEVRTGLKVFLFGRNVQDNEDDCALVNSVNRILNVSTIVWGCAKSNQRVNDSPLLPLQPSADMFARSLMSVLRHFQWRKLAWVQITGKNHFATCDQLNKMVLSSGYFMVRVFQSIDGDALKNERSEQTSKDLWAEIFRNDISGESAELYFRKIFSCWFLLFRC